MVVEAIAAMLVGMAGLVLVLQPLLRPPRPWRPPEPLDPEETPRGVALTALKEIDFDRETGKLSDVDYQYLKAKYTAAALDALREEEPPRPISAGESQPACRTCGPRPEADALFCSSCGLRLIAASLSETTGLAASPRPTPALPANPLQAN
jgi:hypothetical protein